jgi:hypothetical protein
LSDDLIDRLSHLQLRDEGKMSLREVLGAFNDSNHVPEVVLNVTTREFDIFSEVGEEEHNVEPTNMLTESIEPVLSVELPCMEMMDKDDEDNGFESPQQSSQRIESPKSEMLEVGVKFFSRDRLETDEGVESKNNKEEDDDLYVNPVETVPAISRITFVSDKSVIDNVPVAELSPKTIPKATDDTEYVLFIDKMLLFVENMKERETIMSMLEIPVEYAMWKVYHDERKEVLGTFVKKGKECKSELNVTVVGHEVETSDHNLMPSIQDIKTRNPRVRLC